LVGDLKNTAGATLRRTGAPEHSLRDGDAWLPGLIGAWWGWCVAGVPLTV